MSRILNVASAVFVIFGIWGVIGGLESLFLPESMIEMLGVTVSQIRAFGQNLVDGMMRAHAYMHRSDVHSRMCFAKRLSKQCKNRKKERAHNTHDKECAHTIKKLRVNKQKKGKTV